MRGGNYTTYDNIAMNCIQVIKIHVFLNFSIFDFCALNRCQHGESMAHQQSLISEWKGRYITVLNQNEDL